MSPGMVTILDFTRGRGSTVGGNHRWLPLTYFRCSHLSLISFFILCLSLFFVGIVVSVLVLLLLLLFWVDSFVANAP